MIVDFWLAHTLLLSLYLSYRYPVFVLAQVAGCDAKSSPSNLAEDAANGTPGEAISLKSVFN